MEYRVTLEVNIHNSAVDEHFNDPRSKSVSIDRYGDEGYLLLIEDALLSHKLVTKVISMQQVRESRYLYFYEVIVQTKTIQDLSDFWSSLEQNLMNAWGGVESLFVSDRFFPVFEDENSIAPNSGRLILCPMKLKCEEKWDLMARTDDRSIRFCAQCKSEVHHVKTAKTLKEAVDNNWCIYYEEPESKVVTVGLPRGHAERAAKILGLD